MKSINWKNRTDTAQLIVCKNDFTENKQIEN